MPNGTQNDGDSLSGRANEKHVIIAEVPRDTPTVGATLRPPRPLTVGRRRSDRWVATCLAVFLMTASLFVLVQTFRTHALIDAVERRHLQCPVPVP